RRDAAWRAAAEHNRRRAFVVLLVPLVPGAILVVLGTVVTALFVAGGVLLAAWLALAALTWTGLGTREPAGRPGAPTQRTAGLDEAVAAGTVTPAAADRLEDLISSLCGTLGLPRPRVRIVDSPWPEMYSLGRDAATATVFVSSSLLESLDRIELEAALAHELSHVKRLDVLTGSLAASQLLRPFDALSGGRLSTYLLGEHRETDADLAGVGVTRYPPGLFDALEKLSELSGSLSTSARPDDRPGTPAVAALLLAGGTRGDLEERLELLREL
ncbi:MAG: M48 family metallopeptidase, partial [Acidimicrobiales bacterium]